ncbi:ThuA domain-containing protein [Paenibacillus hexagrammi]|uniref:ThuA domain-containing protein n=1 Tax=Paenibacillus hexagrammi TaxID=2908839 RepID=A0ABY3SD97_9BACL|nr:ThuA domain-containing protein [Paenibacillus sp. YPD9-1]UJF31787.1 ThuA domain-containing protein [Paenibacillus sp. YPD9-1]
MRIGVLCGDNWHPAITVIEGLRPLEPRGFQFEFIVDTADWKSDVLEQYSAVILSKSNRRSPEDAEPWLTEEIQMDFDRYVAKGGGLLVIHSGTVGYANEKCFRELVGGVFTQHPEAGWVTLEYAEDTSWFGNEYPPFKIFDEHYFVNMFDEQAEIFMTSSSQSGKQPAGWIKRHGRGQVCVLTPGHYLEVWLNPHYQRTIESALTKVARKGQQAD